MCWHCHVYGHPPWAYYAEPPPYVRRMGRWGRRMMLEEMEPEEESEELEQEKRYLERRLKAIDKEIEKLKGEKQETKEKS